jgi:hypothetical protein
MTVLMTIGEYGTVQLKVLLLSDQDVMDVYWWLMKTQQFVMVVLTALMMI